MVFLQLRPEVLQFFDPYFKITESNVLFTYMQESHVIGHEHWSEKGVRIPVCKGIWLATDSLPVTVSDLFVGHSASDILCFCHYYPNWLTSPCTSAFASFGLLPTKEQFTRLKSLFPNAKIHTVFDRGVSGRVADCKVATWQFGRNAKFTLVDDYGELHYNRKLYRIPINIFSLNRFEKLSGTRSGVRTHKPKAPFETFYQFFKNKG